MRPSASQKTTSFLKRTQRTTRTKCRLQCMPNLDDIKPCTSCAVLRSLVTQLDRAQSLDIHQYSVQTTYPFISSTPHIHVNHLDNLQSLVYLVTHPPRYSAEPGNSPDSEATRGPTPREDGFELSMSLSAASFTVLKSLQSMWGLPLHLSTALGMMGGQ